MPGHIYGSNWDWVPCQAEGCIDGRVSSPSPRLIVGEQVGHAYYFGPDSESQWQFVNGPRNGVPVYIEVLAPEETP